MQIKRIGAKLISWANGRTCRGRAFGYVSMSVRASLIRETASEAAVVAAG